MIKKFQRYLIAAALMLTPLMLAHNTYGDPPVFTSICHATSSETNPYNFLTLPPEPLSAHFDEFGTPLAGHEKDFIPTDSDCDISNDGGGEPPPPGSTPEPITMLLFGAGLAGVGYVSRRYLKKGDSDDIND